MSQLNAATTQVNTVTSSGSTVAIPKNIDVTGNINFTEINYLSLIHI